MRLADLPTPSLLLDRARLERNLRHMAERMARLRVGLRPHLKTAKSVEVARLAQDLGARGLTVSTLAEAEAFFLGGFGDILYGVGIEPGKFGQAARLRAEGCDLSVILDDMATAQALAAHHGPFAVLIEVDSGQHRCGVDPEGRELIEIAKTLILAPQVEFRGVMTHAGHAYACRTPAEMAAVAEEEREAVVRAARRLEGAGIPCPVVSAGSTPTALHARHLEGVTEMRPGVYMFQDLFQSGIGACAADDMAVSVLASVIGQRIEDNRLMIDAGALALSQDRSTGALKDRDALYGTVVGLDGKAIVPGLHVFSVHQEHGFVTAPGRIPFERFPIGAKVRVFPNHVCITAAMHDAYQVIEGDQVIAQWPRIRGW